MGTVLLPVLRIRNFLCFPDTKKYVPDPDHPPNSIFHEGKDPDPNQDFRIWNTDSYIGTVPTGEQF
jgi:hypothetical protein